ncbi:hypothetical protein [Pseudoalteromonas sp. SMS1]|nr:hypothetical protein [Pseudoalteromonas sp. SMS1]
MQKAQAYFAGNRFQLTHLMWIEDNAMSDKVVLWSLITPSTTMS